ncbi:MAG: hypothetical protein KJ070_25905 [Verrucomicrobia bacterium]|nr:hypothetical protein [Verrucomicrobiota bacterium]
MSFEFWEAAAPVTSEKPTSARSYQTFNWPTYYAQKAGSATTISRLLAPQAACRPAATLPGPRLSVAIGGMEIASSCPLDYSKQQDVIKRQANALFVNPLPQQLGSRRIGFIVCRIRSTVLPSSDLGKPVQRCHRFLAFILWIHSQKLVIALSSFPITFSFPNTSSK